jgi:hypothetical protein
MYRTFGKKWGFLHESQIRILKKSKEALGKMFLVKD